MTDYLVKPFPAVLLRAFRRTGAAGKSHSDHRMPFAGSTLKEPLRWLSTRQGSQSQGEGRGRGASSLLASPGGRDFSPRRRAVSCSACASRRQCCPAPELGHRRHSTLSCCVDAGEPASWLLPQFPLLKAVPRWAPLCGLSDCSRAGTGTSGPGQQSLRLCQRTVASWVWAQCAQHCSSSAFHLRGRAPRPVRYFLRVDPHGTAPPLCPASALPLVYDLHPCCGE